MDSYLILNFDGLFTEITNKDLYSFKFIVEVHLFNKDGERSTNKIKNLCYYSIIPNEIKIDNLFHNNYEYSFMITLQLKISDHSLHKITSNKTLKNTINHMIQNISGSKLKTLDNKVYRTYVMDINYDFSTIRTDGGFHVKNKLDKEDIVLVNMNSIDIYRSNKLPDVKITGKSDFITSHFYSYNDSDLFTAKINKFNENNIKKNIENENAFVDIIKIQNIYVRGNISINWYFKRYPIHKFQMFQREENILNLN